MAFCHMLSNFYVPERFHIVSNCRFFSFPVLTFMLPHACNLLDVLGLVSMPTIQCRCSISDVERLKTRPARPKRSRPRHVSCAGGSNPREARLCDGHHEVPRRMPDHRPRLEDMHDSMLFLCSLESICTALVKCNFVYVCGYTDSVCV